MIYTMKRGHQAVWDKATRRYKYVHRMVMEQSLGRKLLTSEVVHHKDGNPSNNVLDNLEVLSWQEHGNHHGMPRGKYKGSCTLCGEPQHAKGLCKKHYAQTHRREQGW